MYFSMVLYLLSMWLGMAISLRICLSGIPSVLQITLVPDCAHFYWRNDNPSTAEESVILANAGIHSPVFLGSRLRGSDESWHSDIPI